MNIGREYARKNRMLRIEDHNVALERVCGAQHIQGGFIIGVATRLVLCLPLA